jgi:hypothetical protein
MASMADTMPELVLIAETDAAETESSILDFQDNNPIYWTHEPANHWPSHR